MARPEVALRAVLEPGPGLVETAGVEFRLGRPSEESGSLLEPVVKLARLVL